MTKIQSITALEILDSRGNPTVMVNVALNNGLTASACVPSGASTGIREAVELRDGDEKRYGGKGVLEAVANVNKHIAPRLKGKSPRAQQEIDNLMRKLDGTDTKSKLGANAILGVSMAVCRTAALDEGVPLYACIRRLHGGKASAPYVLVTSVGDEGGFAPNLKTNDEAVEVIVEAIKAAGYKPGKEIAIALGTGAGQIKTGSLCRSERIAKYNRLLAMEQELARKARYGGATARAESRDRCW